MKKKDALTESLEDYLETILELEKKNKVARVKDIAEKLEIQRGSVSGALKVLCEKGLINYEPYSFITLTDKGISIAKKITRRHNILQDFLTRIVQLTSEQANIMACRMEHTVDETSMARIVQFIEFIDNCPRTGPQWIDSFVNYCSNRQPQWKRCTQCIEKCREKHEKKAILQES
jgi:DtxR family Mn-dependent transcriptional regulator